MRFRLPPEVIPGAAVTVEDRRAIVVAFGRDAAGRYVTVRYQDFGEPMTEKVHPSRVVATSGLVQSMTITRVEE